MTLELDGIALFFGYVFIGASFISGVVGVILVLALKYLDLLDPYKPIRFIKDMDDKRFNEYFALVKKHRELYRQKKNFKKGI